MTRGVRKEKFYDESITEVRRDGVEKEITEESPAEVETNGPGTINGTIVNTVHVKVRKDPNFDSELIDVWPRGRNVTIVGKEKNGFYEVLVDDDTRGYIASKFIKEE